VIHPIRAWNAFFFRPTSARPLGAIRICFGLLVLTNLALCAVDLDHWYTGVGLLQGAEARVIAGPLQMSPLQWFQDPTTVRAVFAATAVAAALLTIGWCSRPMSVLVYLGLLTIQFRNLVSSSGADVLLMTFAFNLMFCPSGAAYSVDAWIEARRRGTPAEPLILPWGLRLIQIQISLVYSIAAILKVGGGLWLNGTALHYVLANSEVRRLDVSFLTQYPILINLMTYSALAMEFSLAFFLWSRAARPVVICIGVLLHAGIFVTINIPIFGELMWVGYLAFLTPPEFDALLRALDARRLFRRASPAKRPAEAPAPAFIPSTTIRVDAPSPIPAPHVPAVTVESARRYEEDALAERERFGSFQVYM